MLADIALALIDPERRGELLAEALMLAASIEAVEPQGAVTALLADRPPSGLLEAFVARLERGKSDDAEPIRIEILTRSVYRNGASVELPERELSLLLALARQRRSYVRAEIVALLWPELDDVAAREAFNSCHRLPGVVLWTREGGYRLHEHVRIDLRDIEQWVGALTSRRALRAHERDVLRSLYERLRRATLPETEAWEWLAPHLLRASDMCRTVAERLASDALSGGRYEEALEIARNLIEDDPCDEAGREVAIRAHLARGHRSDAMREFRRYREILRDELEAEPSSDLALLLREAQPVVSPRPAALR